MATLEVFYEPGKLFASLPNRRGTWIVPLILSLLLSLFATYAVLQKIGLDTIIRQQIENRSNMTPDQKQQAMTNAENSPAITYIAYGEVAVAILLLPLIVAGGLAVFAMMAPQQPKFGTTFSMVVLAYLPYTVITTIMSVLVLYVSPDPSTLDYQNLLATNVAAFVNKDTTGKAFYAFLGAIDVLSLTEVGFLGYGFSKITRSSFFYGLVSVGCLWVLWVVVKMGLSFLQ